MVPREMSQGLEDSAPTPDQSSLKCPPGLTSTSEYIFNVKMFLNDLIFLQKFWVLSVHLFQSLSESFLDMHVKGLASFAIGMSSVKKERNSVTFKNNSISFIYILYFGILLINRLKSTIFIVLFNSGISKV